MIFKCLLIVILLMTVGCERGRGASASDTSAEAIVTARILTSWLHAENCKFELEPSEFGINLLIDHQNFHNICLLHHMKDYSTYVMTQRISINGRKVPVAIYFPDNANFIRSIDSVEKIIVYVVGGPGSNFNIGNQRIDNDLIAISYARSGGVVVKLGYSGMAYQSSYPNSDLNKSACELVEFVRLIEKSRKFKHTVLYGESIGAKIVLRSLSLYSYSDSSTSVKLVSPIIRSPNYLLKYFENIEKITNQKLLPKNVRVLSDGKEDEYRYDSIPSYLLLKKFFEKSDLDQDIFDDFKRILNRNLKIKIVYGENDMRIGSELLMKNAIEFGDVSLLRIKGMNHSPRNIDDALEIVQ